MKLALDIVNPLDFRGWDDLVLSHPAYSVFHSSAWARVLVETYGYSPNYLLAIKDGKIAALVPQMEVDSILTGRRSVCLPFSDYCDPLVGEGTAAVEAMSELIRHGKNARWRSIELRCCESFSAEAKPSASYLGHSLDLDGDEARLFRGFRASTQRNVRKAEREGVSVCSSTTADSMAEFCRLNCITRKEHGLPPQPQRFFRKLHEHILRNNGGFIVLGRLRRTCISAAVFLYFGNRVFYKYGASDKVMQHLRANNLVMWEAIRSCATGGFRSFCFGRTEHENEGLRQFKVGWGARESLIQYFRYDLREGRFVPGRIAISGWHNLLFRTVPSSVSQAIGNVLYKHFG
jgi:hypothetical protein